MSPLYREIVVWRRVSADKAIRYTCFEDVQAATVCVQVADHLRPSPDDADDGRELRLELLLEGQLDSCRWLPSLADAIATFDAEFGN